MVDSRVGTSRFGRTSPMHPVTHRAGWHLARGAEAKTFAEKLGMLGMLGMLEIPTTG
jgi:hypothetical protein